MRKEIDLFVGCFIILVLSISLINCADTTANSETTDTITASSIPAQDQAKIDKAFECLENKTVGKAKQMSIEEIAFIILASPKSGILTEYKNELIARKYSQSTSLDCWPSGGCKVKDTALAVLALNHLGENTDRAEDWLSSKNKTATDIQWLLQEDSESETVCKITYDQRDYETTIGLDKKVLKNAGNCLSISPNGFWFSVATNCYDQEFIITCDKNFIANLLYRKPGAGNTYYVDSNTQSSPALGSVTIKINSKCFGISSCEYEGSLWAALALLKTGHDISMYVPYLIALSEANKGLFPESFLYMITNFEDYANWLIQKQKLGNYWEAEGTPNGKFYDTALALVALKSSNAEQVARAKKQMEFFQDTSGCWMSNKMIRDTAILVWALFGRPPSIVASGGATTRCTEAGYYCTAEQECAESDQLGDNYFCSNLQKCCKTQNLKTCDQLDGKVCSSGKECSGNTRQASDENECCLQDCIEPPQETECEQNENYCQTECASNQEEISDECNAGMICCKTQGDDPGSSSWWIWLLVLGIIVLIGIIAYVKREELKLWWFKRQNKVHQGSPGGTNFGGLGFRPGPPFGPRPGGFPPTGGMARQMMRPGFSQARPVSTGRAMQRAPAERSSNSLEEDEVFRKLREMSK